MNPSKIYIVRIIDHKSEPMVGIICPTGKPGTMCWDPECRIFNPHDQVLVTQKSHDIIGLDTEELRKISMTDYKFQFTMNADGSATCLDEKNPIENTIDVHVDTHGIWVNGTSIPIEVMYKVLRNYDLKKIRSELKDYLNETDS